MKLPQAQLAAGRVAWARQRFDRLGLGIRCAYNPGQPAVIRVWLGLGIQMARTGSCPSCP